MRRVSIEINVFEGLLRGYFWLYEEGKEPYCVSNIEIGRKKDFQKFKRWIDKLTDTIEKTSVDLGEDAGWGDYSLFRVDDKLRSIKIIKKYGKKVDKDRRRQQF